MRKVLVLEDESSIRSFIVINLRRAGYEVVEAETGEEALDKLHENPDTLVALLDVMLPGIDGFEVCRRIRATNPRIGIIMLTARSQEMDKVTGLMNGADDYVTKPFSPVELTARVDALIRRSSGRPSPLLTYGNVAFDPETRKVTSAGREVVLSPKETALLELLLLNKNKVLSKEAIESKIYSWDDEVSSNAVEVHIHHLRKKLGKDIVRTVNKIGYILEET